MYELGERSIIYMSVADRFITMSRNGQRDYLYPIEGS